MKSVIVLSVLAILVGQNAFADFYLCRSLDRQTTVFLAQNGTKHYVARIQSHQGKIEVACEAEDGSQNGQMFRTFFCSNSDSIPDMIFVNLSSLRGKIEFNQGIDAELICRARK
jgi:hypothetical protein